MRDGHDPVMTRCRRWLRTATARDERRETDLWATTRDDSWLSGRVFTHTREREDTLSGGLEKWRVRTRWAKERIQIRRPR